jgi:hypothetical protein
MKQIIDFVSLGVVTAAFGVWRSAFGVRRSAFGVRRGFVAMEKSVTPLCFLPQNRDARLSHLGAL